MNADDIRAAIDEISRKMDEANVPHKGRIMRLNCPDHGIYDIRDGDSCRCPRCGWLPEWIMYLPGVVTELADRSPSASPASPGDGPRTS